MLRGIAAAENQENQGRTTFYHPVHCPPVSCSNRRQNRILLYREADERPDGASTDPRSSSRLNTPALLVAQRRLDFLSVSVPRDICATCGLTTMGHAPSTPLNDREKQCRGPTDHHDADHRLDPAQQAPIVLQQRNVTIPQRGEGNDGEVGRFLEVRQVIAG